MKRRYSFLSLVVFAISSCSSQTETAPNPLVTSPAVVPSTPLPVAVPANKAKNVYPPEAISNYVDVCTKGGGTKKSCTCFITKAQSTYPLDKLIKINNDGAIGKPYPKDITEILNSCQEKVAAAPETTALINSPQPISLNSTKQSQTVSDSIIVSPNLKKEIQKVIDIFFAFDSRTSSGINYNRYVAELGDLKVALDRLERFPNASQSLPFLKLTTAYSQYAFAKIVWEACINNIDCSDNQIGGPFTLAGEYYPPRNIFKVLTEDYKIPVFEISNGQIFDYRTPSDGRDPNKPQQKIQLKTALSGVWGKAKTVTQEASQF